MIGFLKLLRKIPSDSTLKKNAFKYNRKAFRKEVIERISLMSVTIKKMSKKGKTHCNWSVSEEKLDSWATMVAFRWFRRNTKLHVRIEEEYITTKSGRYIDRMTMNVIW